MNKTVTIKPNPSRQQRDKKILEVSFTNSEGEHKGFLMSLRFADDKPIVNVYRIDKGINVYVDDKRE